jgi:RNA polymerase sigma-70 factor (ECF subfamily)
MTTAAAHPLARTTHADAVRAVGAQSDDAARASTGTQDEGSAPEPETQAFPASAENEPLAQLAASEPLAQLAEARLFARATEGDREAIDAVWRANRGWLAGVLAAHAPRGAEIEDLLQEVAATFVSKAREVRDALSLRGWLRTVAVNAARISARSRGIERRSIAQAAHDARRAQFDRDEALLREARDAEDLLALLREIPALYAEVLLLQAARGLSQRAIAELLEVPETTVETRLARGRRLLRAAAARRDAAGAHDHEDRDLPRRSPTQTSQRSER